MLPESIKHELYKFLTAVDSHVSFEIERFRALDEDGLSNKLLQCLDDVDQAPEAFKEQRRNFDAAIKAINEKEDFDPPFHLTVTHERFTKAFEGAVTQSDLLLELEYTDPNTIARSWTALYLVQAKLPPSGYPGQQKLDAIINFQIDQQERIERFRQRVGRTAFKYCFYCRSGVLTRDETCEVVARLRQRYGDVADEIRANVASGIWLACTPHPSIRDIIEEAEERSFCLARFVVGHYDDRENGENLENEIARYPADSTDANYLFLKRLCARDESALEEIWRLIGGRRVRSPRYVLRHLRVTVSGPAPRPAPISGIGP